MAHAGIAKTSWNNSRFQLKDHVIGELYENPLIHALCSIYSQMNNPDEMVFYGGSGLNLFREYYGTMAETVTCGQIGCGIFLPNGPACIPKVPCGTVHRLNGSAIASWWNCPYVEWRVSCHELNGSAIASWWNCPLC